MKKNKFKAGLLIYAGILLAVMIIVLLSIRSILVKYEKAQGYNIVNQFCDKLEADLLFNSLENEKDVIDYSKLSKFEDKDEVIKNYIKFFAGKDLQSALSAKSYDANNPVYLVKSGEDEVGEIKLKLVSEKTKLGMLSIPEWELVSFTPSIASLGNAYAVSVPENFKVSFNGVELSDNDIASKQNGIVIYLVKGILLEPEISVKNPDNEDVKISIEKQDPSKAVFTVTADYTLFSFTVPSDFTVSSEKSFTKESAEGLTTYSAVFEKMPTAEEMNSLFEVLDLAGDRMQFKDNEGVPAPSYYAYDVSLPKGFTAKIGEKQVTLETLEETAASGKQYSGVSALISTRIFTVNPVITDKSAENAATALLTITDAKNNEIPYTLDSGSIATARGDFAITVPENFTLKINGAAPDVEGVKTAIKEYEDIKQYVSVPDAVTYTLKDQCAPVEITVTDNNGNTKNYLVSKNFSILEQTGADTIPDFAKGKVDPLDYAKQWSLFLSDDLKGDKHGYNVILNYILRDSYLNTIAYNWATNVDVSFLGSHTFDNPPFSREKVSNYVVLGDNSFYCDIYFIKSFTVNSNKTHRDDIFSNRLYFLYTDDTNDGNDNPHWVIAALNEVSNND